MNRITARQAALLRDIKQTGGLTESVAYVSHGKRVALSCVDAGLVKKKAAPRRPSRFVLTSEGEQVAT